jgi:hypothetical protein
VGVAGRVLWLYEALQAEASAAALELMNRVRPPDRHSSYDYYIAELLRPVIGVKATAARLRRIPPDGHDATASVLYLRARLPVPTVSGDDDARDHGIAEARRLARGACAPALG